MNLFKYLTTLLIAPALTFTQPVLAQKNEPDLSKKLTMYAKPAVVRIISSCRGTYTLYDLPRDNEMANKIDVISINLNFVGTGFLINPNGYIVTSSKVTESQEDCKKALARNIKDKLANDYRGYDEDLEDSDKLYKLNENDIINDSYKYARFEPIFGGKRNSNGEREYEGEWDVYFPLSQNNNPLINQNSKLIEVKYSGRKEGQALKINKDVAIIKVAMTNAPALKLADSGEVQIQDRVIAVGYPTAADLELGQDIRLTEQSYLESSVQEGRISNPNKELEGGYPVLQIDIRAAEGSAGSPLINEQGEVVGMLIFNDSDKDSDDDNGENVPLAIPTSTLQEFIRQSGATNQQSKTDLLYREGLEKFWQGKYREAKANFLQVRNLYPFHSEVDKLISEIDQIEAERWAKPWTNPTYIFSAGLILAAGAVGGIAYFFLKQKANFARAGAGGYRSVGSTEGNSVFTSSFKSNGKGAKCFIEMEYKEQIERFQLTQEKHRLGRDPSWSDLTLPSSWELISRHHAILKQEGDDYYIFDGDGKSPSRNGLWVNEDYPIDTQGHLLKNGDKLKIGQDVSEQVVLTYYNPNSEQAYPKTTMAR